MTTRTPPPPRPPTLTATSVPQMRPVNTTAQPPEPSTCVSRSPSRSCAWPCTPLRSMSVNRARARGPRSNGRASSCVRGRRRCGAQLRRRDAEGQVPKQGVLARQGRFHSRHAHVRAHARAHHAKTGHTKSQPAGWLDVASFRQANTWRGMVWCHTHEHGLGNLAGSMFMHCCRLHACIWTSKRAVEGRGNGSDAARVQAWRCVPLVRRGATAISNKACRGQRGRRLAAWWCMPTHVMGRAVSA